MNCILKFITFTLELKRRLWSASHPETVWLAVSFYRYVLCFAAPSYKTLRMPCCLVLLHGCCKESSRYFWKCHTVLRMRTYQVSKKSSKSLFFC